MADRPIRDPRYAASWRSQAAGEILLPRDEAVAQLLVVHRNATHGYGGRQNIDDTGQVTNRRELGIGERLLAHHSGEIPAGIAMLPYLYLLSALVQPEPVEKRIMEAVLQKL